MKKNLLLIMLTVLSLSMAAQNVTTSRARYHQGDDPSWAKPETADADWEEMDITKNWDDQGKVFNNTYVWYRIHLTIPSSLLMGADQQKIVVFDLPSADDTDETYLNGRLIGKKGSMPSDEGGYRSAWSVERSYSVDAKSGGIRWDQDNVIAVRVYNGGEPGGLFGRPLTVRVPNITDGLSMQFNDAVDGQTPQCTLQLTNEYKVNQVGTVTFNIIDRETGRAEGSLTRKVTVRQGKPVRLSLP
ncbi:MAG: hypothetical protein K6A67_03330, partial [Bacteroidales bacterium]|nr:hypothetical protein [Bacteroidales bacterium]